MPLELNLLVQVPAVDFSLEPDVSRLKVRFFHGPLHYTAGLLVFGPNFLQFELPVEVWAEVPLCGRKLSFPDSGIASRVELPDPWAYSRFLAGT